MTFSFVKWIRVGIGNQMFSDPDHLEANGDRKASLKATFCYISLYPQLECNFGYLFISLLRFGLLLYIVMLSVGPQRPSCHDTRESAVEPSELCDFCPQVISDW